MLQIALVLVEGYSTNIALQKVLNSHFRDGDHLVQINEPQANASSVQYRDQGL